MCDRRPRVAGAGGINEDARLHAAPHGTFKGGDEFSSAGVVVENVGAKRDRCFRRFDRGQHGGKRLVAVDEGIDFVASGQRLRDHTADDAGKLLEMFRARVFRFAEVVRRGAAESAVDTE